MTRDRTFGVEFSLTRRKRRDHTFGVEIIGAQGRGLRCSAADCIEIWWVGSRRPASACPKYAPAPTRKAA